MGLLHWARENNIHEKLLPVLQRRGISSVDACRQLFFGTLDDTLPATAFGLAMYKAVKRLQKAFILKERIRIVGDYDADGTTGTAIVMGVLLRLQPYYGFDVDFMIPNRFSEGYGLNEKNIGRLLDSRPDLVITIDCGISSGAQIAQLQALGIDVIVTDHHEPKGEIPDRAYAIIHPKYCDYPFQGLSGAAVAYQFMKGIWETQGKKAPDWVVLGMLDLVAVGAVCDIMPLQSDNRIYVREGLKLIQQGHRLAFELMGKRLKWKKVDTYTLGFQVGPRVNAAGRIEDADCVVHLFLSNKEEECNAILDELEDRNKRRQEEQEYVLKEGMLQITNSRYRNISVVIGDHSFHEGVLGICASKFQDTAYKPTFVLAPDEEGYYLKGSARSIEGINLFEVMQKHEMYLHKWGGHHAAAGLTIMPEVAHNFFSAVDSTLDYVSSDTWIKTQYWEGEIDATDITPNFFENLLALQPFGVGFASINWKVTGEILQVRDLGEDKRGGKLLLNSRKAVPFIMWQNGSKVNPGQTQTFYGQWEWSDYISTVQFRALDVESKAVPAGSV